MKYYGKTLSLMLVLFCILTLSSCKTQVYKYETDKLSYVEGKISTTVYSACYNGDGTFSLVIAISNDTKFSKKLQQVYVNQVYDAKNRIIAQDGSFKMDDNSYLLAGGTNYVQCDFNESEVLIKTSIDKIYADVTYDFISCVKNAADPKVSDTKGYTYNITNAEFNSVGGLNGTIAIRNNYDTAKTPKSITFEITTDEGKAVTINAVTRTNDNEIAAGKVLTLDFAIMPANTQDEIASSLDFNTLVMKNVTID